MKNITLCIAFLFVLLLGGCAPSFKPIYMSQEEFQKSFGNTFISTCVRQCSGGNFKSLYDAKNWYGLAYAEYTAGSYDDLGFYYMGIAAENLNFKEMSQRYYEAALRNSGNAGCRRKSSGCDGFTFPDDIYTKLDKFSREQGYANYQVKLASDKAAVDADLKKRASLAAEEDRKERLSGLSASDLKKYNVNNEEEIKKLKNEFEKNKSLYGNDTSPSNFLKFLGDKQGAMSENITIAQYIQKRQAEEKRVKDLAIAEQQRQARALEEKRKNIKLTTMFLCIDKLGANRDKGLAENLMGELVKGDHRMFGYMITNSVYAQFCSQVIVPFNDMNAFNAGSRLFATRDGVDYYLVSDAYKTWGVMGK